QLITDLPFEYNANKALTNAEAITLLTKALELKGAGDAPITAVNLVETYKNLNSNEWYSEYYVNAINNEVVINNDVKATDVVTREQFAGWIIDQFDRIGPYPVIMMYIHIADEEDITTELSGKIQTLLLTQMTELNEAGQFRPQDPITGEEAVQWLKNAAEFANNLKSNLSEDVLESVIPF